MENEKLKELEIRIQNLELVKQIIEQELYSLLEEKDVLETRNPIGFKINQNNNGKTKNPKSTS